MDPIINIYSSALIFFVTADHDGTVGVVLNVNR